MLESTLKEIELRYDNSDRKIFDDFRVPTFENAKYNVKNFSTYLLEIATYFYRFLIFELVTLVQFSRIFFKSIM